MGGAERLAIEMVRVLDRNRYEPAFCVFDEDGPLRNAMEQVGAPLFRFRRGARPVTLFRLVKAIRKFRPHLIHAHSVGPGYYAALVGALMRVPVLMTYHGQPTLYRVRSIDRRLSNRLTDRFIAVSDDVRRLLVEHGGVPPGKAFTIINGVDFATFSRPRDESLRDALELPTTGFLFGTVGRLNPLKAQDVMLKALRMLLDQGREASLVIAGEGETRQELERIVRELRLEGNVKLLGARDDVPSLLHAIDGFLLSSTSEGIPLSVLEAMAAGLPILSTSVGGVPEIVSNEITGLLVPPGDVTAFAAGMKRMMSEPELAAQLGRAAAETARTHFSLEAMVERYCEHYEKLLQR